MQTTTNVDVFTDQLKNDATIVQAGEGTILRAGDGSCTFKVTSEMSNGRLGVYEIVVPPHTMGARLHYHRYMDEVFIVRKGVLTLDLSTQTHYLGEGATAYVPRFTPHGFSNTSDEAVEVTLLFNPSEQREGYFTGLFELLNTENMDMDRFSKLSQKYDSHPLNPSLLQQLL